MMKLVANVLFVLGLVGLTSVAYAQNSAFAGKQVTLHNHTLSISEEFQLQLADLVEDFLERDIMDERDPLKQKLIDPCYARVKAGIEAKTAMTILPKETLEGKVTYDAYGYPAGTRQKAAKVGSTPYYLKLDIQITARDILENSLTVNGSGHKGKKIKAHVAINSTLFDNNGKRCASSCRRRACRNIRAAGDVRAEILSPGRARTPTGTVPMMSCQ